MHICVVALGKIGLPLAVQFASKGHSVIGADVDERVVELVNAGKEPFPGEADLDVRLKDVVAQRAVARDDRHDRGGRVSRTQSWWSFPCSWTPEGVPDFALDGRRDCVDRCRVASWHAGQLRDHASGRNDS